jgi:hypothetical protein
MSRMRRFIAGPFDTSRRLRTEVESFFSWWTQELRDIGATLLARIAPNLVRPLVVRLDGDALIVGDEPVPTELADTLRGSRAIAVLASTDALVHELTLPAAVERDIERALDLHLERELPLSRDRVCVDWRLVRREREHRRIIVRVLVAHRDRVEALRDAVAAKGLRPVRVAAFGPSGELLGNLQPRQHRTARLRLTALDRKLALAAASLAVAAACVIAGQWIYERVSVQDEVIQARELAATTGALTRRLREESASAVALVQLMRVPDAVDVLTALTSTTPQDTWAYELDVKPEPAGGYQVKMGGFAPAATTFVDTLEKSPQFGHVRLVSAASAGLGTARDRLQVSAKWEQR